ncbi:Serine/threonine-protein kinase TOUSLED [Populus alba x Populus x berolinensis]|nr:Serine/threonine-protein kinase TOUSLED [Populus alba x Populus x berolinensis]
MLDPREWNLHLRELELTGKYLPPACFELNKTPLISLKVGVWSAGVLFYQMIFGRRPFGHDLTQERIPRDDNYESLQG